MTAYANPAKLIATMREMKQHPTQVYEIQVPGWFSEYWNYNQLRSWFMRCLNNKINRNDTRTGRCYTQEWQQNMTRDARIIQQYYGQRVRRSGSNILNTPEMKRRYPNLDNSPYED